VRAVAVKGQSNSSQSSRVRDEADSLRGGRAIAELANFDEHLLAGWLGVTAA